MKPTCRKSWAGNLLMCLDLCLGPLLQGQMSVAKLKSAYYSLMAPRCLGYQAKLYFSKFSAAILNFGGNGKCRLSQKTITDRAISGKCWTPGYKGIQGPLKNLLFSKFWALS